MWKGSWETAVIKLCKYGSSGFYFPVTKYIQTALNLSSWWQLPRCHTTRRLKRTVTPDTSFSHLVFRENPTRGGGGRPVSGCLRCLCAHRVKRGERQRQERERQRSINRSDSQEAKESGNKRKPEMEVETASGGKKREKGKETGKKPREFGRQGGGEGQSKRARATDGGKERQRHFQWLSRDPKWHCVLGPAVTSRPCGLWH